MRQKLRNVVDIFLIAPRPTHTSDYWRETAALIELADATSDVAGLLIHTGNDMPLEPFTLAQIIFERSKTLVPLVAVNPVYQHPYSVARVISSFYAIYGRPIYLNLVTGVSVRHLQSLGDELSHDERYIRLEEFGKVIQSLLRPSGVTTFDGRFYRLLGAQLAQRLPEGVNIDFLIAGASDASRRSAVNLDAVHISMFGTSPAAEASKRTGLHFGLVARHNQAAALDVARRTFADNGSGADRHAIALQFSDSEWKHQLEAQAQSAVDHTTSWMVPFRSGRADCPYLVGDHSQIAETLAHLIVDGTRTLVLDIIPTAADFEHLNIVLERVSELLERGNL
jgi:alkanesulfonate monooxygenase